jgi:hypothetical protein
VDRPSPITTWLELQRDIEAELLGDTLFLFIIHEIGEAGLSLQEQIRRLDQAATDVLAVRIRGDLLEEGGI